MPPTRDVRPDTTGTHVEVGLAQAQTYGDATVLDVFTLRQSDISFVKDCSKNRGLKCISIFNDELISASKVIYWDHKPEAKSLISYCDSTVHDTSCDGI